VGRQEEGRGAWDDVRGEDGGEKGGEKSLLLRGGGGSGGRHLSGTKGKASWRLRGTQVERERRTSRLSDQTIISM
jgi:hypothetical protein